MKASVTMDATIKLTSETAEDAELLKHVAFLKGNYWDVSVSSLGSDCDVTLVSVEPTKKVEPLPTSILSGAHHELSHIPSQRQASKVASYFAELHAHHIPQEFAEQLTLEYQRMEMENA